MESDTSIWSQCKQGMPINEHTLGKLEVRVLCLGWARAMVQVGIRRLKGVPMVAGVSALAYSPEIWWICDGPVYDRAEVDATLPEAFGVRFFESEGIDTVAWEAPDAASICV